jgi:predicted nicotinamide N-methyase
MTTLNTHVGERKDKMGKKKSSVSSEAQRGRTSKVATPSLSLKINGSQEASSSDATTNRPRNHLIRDATTPFTFCFSRFGSQSSVTVLQTAEEETWPGGVLWDVGVLLAKLLVMINSPPPSSASSSSKKTKCDLFIPRLVAPGIWGTTTWKERRILELGCGVGLTGLVAWKLGARAVLLTDLECVVNGVAKRNVEHNLTHTPSDKRILAIPLCWGNENDEDMVARVLDRAAPPVVHSTSTIAGKNNRRSRKSSKNISQETVTDISNRAGMPDVLLIGDVAYQQKPGADSHFDALISTVLRFTDEHTVVIFGTRMRMPASMDLLQTFRDHFDEVVEPPIEAHEIDIAFGSDALGGKKHNITIHILKRKRILAPT